MTSYQPMTGYGPAAPVFQVEDFVRLVQARRPLIVRIALVVIAAAVVVALALPTVYSSSAVVMLDPRKNSVTDMSAVLAQLEGDPASLQNQIQILTSRDLSAQVVEKLNLQDDPEFNPAGGRPGVTQLFSDLGALVNPRNWFTDDAGGKARANDRVIDNFAKHVSAGTNGLSTAITVTATSSNPDKAARIANAVVNTYIDDQVTTKLNANSGANTWLDQRIHELQQQMQSQETAIATYKAQRGLSDTAPGASLVDQQMVGINGQIVQARSDLAEKEAQNDRVQTLMHSGDASNVAQVISSPLIVALRTQQADLIRQEGELSTQYGPLHPKMKALEAEKTDLDTKITQEVNRLAGSIANDVTVARAHLGSLQSSLGGTVSQQTSQNMARVQLDAMQANAASTRAQYEAFVTRLRQTQDQDAVQTPESRVISQAPVPLTPVSPKRGLIVLASIPLGFLIGLMAALLSERFGYFIPVAEALPGRRAALGAPQHVHQNAHENPSVLVTPAPATEPAWRAPRLTSSAAVWNGPPILAEFPDIFSLDTGDMVLDQPTGPYAHRIAALVRQLEAPDGGAAVVAMTSPAPGESKSAIGVSLARAAAAMGKKVVLLDCDPLQASKRAMRVSATSGLYDVLSGVAPLNKVLTKDPRSEAFVLAMTRKPPNMATMFGSLQMKKLIRLLRENCDMVVVDCTRATTPEASLLARLSDATLLVSRKGALNTPTFTKSVRVLKAAQAAPVGVIVTR